MSRFSASELCDQDFIRYQRQIAVPEINEKGQVTLQQKKVLIIGCGGLGTNVALYLVGAGIGSIVCADDDQVDISNLHRQIAYRESDIGEAKTASLYKQLNALNHTCKIRQISNRMDDEQLRLEIMLTDVVVDCSDNLESRYQINRLCYQQKTDLVSGAAIGWCGQLSVYRFQEASPCYQCLASDLDLETMAGCRDFGVVGPVVGIIGSMQALRVIQLLLALEPSASTDQENMLNTLIHFDGQTMRFKTFQFQKNTDCPVCGLHREQKGGGRHEHSHHN